jgi:hypothetical protein
MAIELRVEAQRDERSVFGVRLQARRQALKALRGADVKDMRL